MNIKNIFLRLFLYYAVIWQVLVFISGTYFSDGPVASGGSFLLVYIFISLLIISRIKDSKIGLNFYFNAICVAAIAQCFIGIMQIIGIDLVYFGLKFIAPDWIKIKPVHAFIGTLGNDNFVSVFLAISLPFFFRRKWVYLTPFIAAGIFLSHTSTAVFSAVVGTGIYLRKFYIVIALIVFFAGYAFFIDTPIYKNDRILIWKSAVVKITESFKTIVFGHGPDLSSGKIDFHNEYLTLFFHYGIFGFIIICMYLILIDKHNKILFSSFGAVLSSCFSNPTMQFAPTLFLVLIIFGLMERSKKEYLNAS